MVDQKYAEIRELLLHQKYEEIVAHGAAAIPHLITALKDEGEDENDVQWKAQEALVKMGAAAVPALIDAFKNEDARRNVTGALGKIAEKGGDCSSAVPVLIEALKEKNGNVRKNAAGALAKIGSPAVPALIGALDSGGRVQQKAVEVLEKIAERIAQRETRPEVVREELGKLVASVKKSGHAAEASRIEKVAAKAYIKMCAIRGKGAAKKHALTGDGVILEGTFKPPRDKTYRQVERRSFA